MNRGTARQFIYNNDEHRCEFLSLLQEINLRYRIEIHAYCLMGNHYHLLLKTPLANLDRAMRHLNGVYTQRYNQWLERDGPLFRGRYRACLIEADNYLLQVSRYIHLNPVAAKISQNPEDYRWSSYKYYIGIEPPPNWLTVEETLNFFNTDNQCHKYRLFVEGEDQSEEKEVEFSQKVKMAILGSEIFIKTVTQQFFQKQHQTPEIPSHKILALFPNLARIQLIVMKFFHLNESELLICQPGTTNWPRLIILYFAVKLSCEKSSTIGNYYGGITGSAVTHAYRKVRDSLIVDSQLADTVSSLEALIMRESNLESGINPFSC